MSEVEEQVLSTSQEGEQTQTGATQPNQPSGETVNEPNDEQNAENEEGKDPNGWALKRIGKLTAKNHETARELEAARSESARYRMLLEQMQQQGQEGQQSQPKLDQSPQDIDALVEQRATQKAQQQAIAERGQSVAKTGAETYADFQQAVQALDSLGITQEQVQSLIGMDDAHQVIYHLGKNPEEADRILSLPPLQQGRELERLAAKAAQAPAPKPVSKAPAPVKPLDSTAAAERDPSKMSTAEWMEWRSKTTQNRF